MPPWWGKSSSKEGKKKGTKESFIDSLHRRFKSPSEGKLSSRSGGSRRHLSDVVLEKGSKSQPETRSPSPSKDVSRCQSFVERSNAQPLPLPGVHPATVRRVDSELGTTTKPRVGKGSKSSLFSPLPRPACIRNRSNRADLEGDLATASVSSASSDDIDELVDLNQTSHQATANSPSSGMLKDRSSTGSLLKRREAKKKPAGLPLHNHTTPTSPNWRPLSSHVLNLQVPHPGAFFSAPDSSMSSPSRSPLRGFGTDQIANSAMWAGKPFTDVTLLGSGHCSSPGSGQNSGQNSMGGDMTGQLFWQQSRGSAECSPIPSPRMASPGPSSRVQSGAVTPIHPRAGGAILESQTSWPEDGKQQSHRLPLPPGTISNSSPFSHPNSAATSPSVPKSPGRAENPLSPGSRWKKGKLLGRGTFGEVYVGFNSESGEMCAMKEVTLFSDDAKSRESAKQLMQEIALLSRLRHPNIVQYYGSEQVEDKLYIYLEYVSGGSIHKILQEYGQLGELAIRSYTQQILSGLAYLHSKSTVHRDIKGPNILVDPNGRVKLADFGMAKHITGPSCPLSFKGSPYWMAPEVIKNSSGCNLAVDIWSLGCTVLEMATAKPPWSQYEGVAALFKIGNSKDLPAIPDQLSDEGKDFVRQCMQRNPAHRPTAAQLLDHPFVRSAAPLERSFIFPESTDLPNGVENGVKALGINQARNFTTLDSERLLVHSSRVPKSGFHASDIHIPRNNISCPVSPIGSPLLHSRSPQHLNRRMSPSPINSPRTTSGASTPLTGGAGAIPFNLTKHSVYFQEGFANNTSKPSNGIFPNGALYHDAAPDIFRVPQGETYDGQSVLADRVSRQLIKDHAKLHSPLDLSPKSPLPSRTNGGGKKCIFSLDEGEMTEWQESKVGYRLLGFGLHILLVLRGRVLIPMIQGWKSGPEWDSFQNSKFLNPDFHVPFPNLNY
uniref:mitogen-activated protein kinase kinase kinase n=1 Tax=Linum usitatissimum TaxID=4006 RepID=A0A172MLK8_LINUS|nr:putative mitogen-activated kinase kinase kinase [Linum usitatissimum]